MRACLLPAMILMAACEQKPEPESPPPPAAKPVIQVPSSPLTDDERQQIEQFRTRSSPLIQELVHCTETLHSETEPFLLKPTQDSLIALRNRLQQCEQLYGTSRVLLGVNETQREAMHQAHLNLGEPLAMPGFIDGISGYPFSGIVNDASLPLEESRLREQHGLTDEADVSLGFAVTGFLLWGEHQYNDTVPPRPVSDFRKVDAWEDSQEELPIEEHPKNRRRTLLTLVTGLLVDDSSNLLQAWQQNHFPPSHEQALGWQVQQMRAMITALDQSPGNPVLINTVENWLAYGKLPVAEGNAPQPSSAADPMDLTDAPPDPAILKARLQSWLDALLRAQG